jgi:putative ABC transport system substrate-binding protein
MKRRQFASVAGMALGIPALPAFAQKDLPLVAVVVPGSASQASTRIVALRAGLQEAGLVEGTHYRLALYFADGVAARMPEIILEAGALKPRVIVSAGLGGTVKRLLPDVPHVFTAIAADPIKIGLIDNYARPGGNTTGNVMTRGGEDGSMTQKRLDYFRQLVPHFKRLGFIGTSTNAVVVDELAALRSMGSRMGFELVHHPLQRIEDIEPALAATAQDGADALYLSGEPLLIANLPRTVQAVAASGIPAVGTYPDFGRAGLLMSYAVDVDDGFRRAGLYVARILRGEKPGDLPVEQASKFTLVVNAATAKRLGITLPTTFVADEVTD